MNKYLGDALHTDLYQINMGYAYFKDGVHERKSYFDVYFRKIPFGGGYAVFAGLAKIIDYVNSFEFSKSDIEFLRELGYEEDFLEYLSAMKFTGSIRSVKEGEIIFANEPLLRIEAPLIQAQIMETAILNIVNYQILIATKAARIKHLCPDEVCMEFGTRRAHEFDAAIWGTRASIIGGFDATSNVKAAKLFNIPCSGTHAHSFVQAYEDEEVAFKKYAAAHKDCYFLVDTYDTLRSGIPTAIKVADELKARFKPEFLNRIDEIITFKALDLPAIKEIVKLSLKDLENKLKSKHITLEFSDKMVDYLANNAYDPHYGARPLRRYIQREIETSLAKKILANEVHEKSNVLIDLDNNHIVFKEK